MKYAIVLVSALLFALGLAIGGMLDPARVVGFLDVFGAWDPTLMFVMGGGLTVNVIAYQISKRRTQPVCDACFHMPKQTNITPDLVIGSAIFGVGWALAGYCPGPALVSLGTGTLTSVVLVAGMIVGSLIGRSASTLFEKG